jgi:hypothetical protein
MSWSSVIEVEPFTRQTMNFNRRFPKSDLPLLDPKCKRTMAQCWKNDLCREVVSFHHPGSDPPMVAYLTLTSQQIPYNHSKSEDFHFFSF